MRVGKRVMYVIDEYRLLSKPINAWYDSKKKCRQPKTTTDDGWQNRRRRSFDKERDETREKWRVN